MANLTIVIDEEVLKNARIRAIQEGTSVNAVVREFLQQYAGNDEEARRRAWASFLESARNSTAGSGGKRTWTRDDLHER